MKHLADIISQLPPEYRLIVALAFLAFLLAAIAYPVLISARKERLPWGASSNRLPAVMLWVMILVVIAVTALFFLNFGIEIWNILTQAVQFPPNWRPDFPNQQPG